MSKRCTKMCLLLLLLGVMCSTAMEKKNIITAAKITNNLGLDNKIIGGLHFEAQLNNDESKSYKVPEDGWEIIDRDDKKVEFGIDIKITKIEGFSEKFEYGCEPMWIDENIFKNVPSLLNWFVMNDKQNRFFKHIAKDPEQRKLLKNSKLLDTIEVSKLEEMKQFFNNLLEGDDELENQIKTFEMLKKFVIEHIQLIPNDNGGYHFEVVLNGDKDYKKVPKAGWVIDGIGSDLEKKKNISKSRSSKSKDITTSLILFGTNYILDLKTINWQQDGC